mmetsp:Transcript_46973/g.77983  ORF Transcript_46973/g.77983 Transcript_46973/m.77983 type:complete len:190 (-) Transcript_46973:49-618(-)
MDSQTRAEFDKLLLVKGNEKCLECGSPNPKWASVNNGALICITCAGKHRGFGVHISFVRSTTMDSWTQKQLKMMRFGGNARLKQFWKDQKFPAKLTAKQKLNNNAMDLYRKQLLDKAKDISNNEPIPFIGYAERKENLQTNVNRGPMTGFGNTGYTPTRHSNTDYCSTILYAGVGIFVLCYLYHIFTKK